MGNRATTRGLFWLMECLSARIEIFVLLRMGEDSVVAVPLERAGVLAHAVLDDFPCACEEHLLFPGPSPVVPDAGHDVADQVAEAHAIGRASCRERVGPYV